MLGFYQWLMLSSRILSFWRLFSLFILRQENILNFYIILFIINFAKTSRLLQWISNKFLWIFHRFFMGLQGINITRTHTDFQETLLNEPVTIEISACNMPFWILSRLTYIIKFQLWSLPLLNSLIENLYKFLMRIKSWRGDYCCFISWLRLSYFNFRVLGFVHLPFCYWCCLSFA